MSSPPPSSCSRETEAQAQAGAAPAMQLVHKLSDSQPPPSSPSPSPPPTFISSLSSFSSYLPPSPPLNPPPLPPPLTTFTSPFSSPFPYPSPSLVYSPASLYRASLTLLRHGPLISIIDLIIKKRRFKAWKFLLVLHSWRVRNKSSYCIWEFW